MAAAAGRRKPSDAGIRMGNEKFMFITHDPEYGSCQLSRQGGGGACAAQLKNGVVIGIWKKDEPMSKGV